MANCSLCGKELYLVFHVADEFSPICCKKCRFDFQKIEPHRTMPGEERIKLLLEKRASNTS